MIDVFVVSVRELDIWSAGSIVGQVIGVANCMEAAEKMIMADRNANFSTSDGQSLHFSRPRTDFSAEVTHNTTMWTIERFTIKGESNV